MGPLRPVRLTQVMVRLEVSMTADLPDGSFVGFVRAAVADGGSIEDAAVFAARQCEAEINEEIAVMVRVIENGVTRDGEPLWMAGGRPWDHEQYAGAVVAADGSLWVQMDNWPGNQWLSPTGQGVRDWEALEFPVKLAPPAWAATL